MHHFLSAIKSDALPDKMILISTTAVYGDCHGDWITENQPVNPQTNRGNRRLDAENASRVWAEKNNIPLVILRVGGIYGPGRLPIARLKKGLPILHEEESPYTNRIHQDDLANICVEAAKYVKNSGHQVAIFNVADGQPGTMSQYFKDVAKACGLPLPPEVTREEAQQQMTAGMLSYLRESRRIDNTKLISELNLDLKYPTLEEGLKNL
jgi:nucleoside-diphosphate-sugar epimerase